MRDLAFNFFNEMRDGQIVAIKEIAKNDPESFKQYLKDYIDAGGHMTISGDWKKFRKDSNPDSFISQQSLA
jgi:hypothetical protein